MTEEEIRIKESEIKYSIGYLVDNLICYKGEIDELTSQLTEKDKQIEELKKTCTELSDNNFKEVAKLEDEIRSKDNQIADLESQIEKMKCCANCSKWLDCGNEIPTEVCEKWEIK